MAILGAIGRRVLRGGAVTPIAAGIAVGLGIRSERNKGRAARDPNDPNPYGLFSSIKEGLFDFAMGDPYADIHMAGFPITVDNYLPIPNPMQGFSNMVGAATFAHNHPDIGGGLPGLMGGMNMMDRTNNWYMNRAKSAVKAGFTNTDYGLSSSDYADIPYVPSTQRTGSYGSGSINRGVQADGSMVFGMYNLRQG